MKIKLNVMCLLLQEQLTMEPPKRLFSNQTLLKLQPIDDIYDKFS